MRRLAQGPPEAGKETQGQWAAIFAPLRPRSVTGDGSLSAPGFVPTSGVFAVWPFDAVGFSATRGVPPMRLLQSVASGALGSPAYQGGATTATLGLVLHFLLMLIIAAIFYFASLRMRFLWRQPLISGAIFGLCVYVVMNFIVLPLSAFAVRPFQINAVFFNLLLAHVCFVGWPIAVAARLSARGSGLARAGRH